MPVIGRPLAYLLYGKAFEGAHLQAVKLGQHLAWRISRRFVGTFAAIVRVALKLVRIFLDVFLVGCVVGAFNKLGPFSVKEMRFAFAARAMGGNP